MNYINRLLGLLVFVQIAVITSAQVGSPYSQFGFGDKQFGGTEEIKAMGGAGIASNSNKFLNNRNPASYAGLDSLTIIYSLGFNSGFNNISTSETTIQKTDTRFSYFNLGFKGNKYWGSSFGLMPATTAEYAYSTADNIDEVGSFVQTYFGNGGLNKFYWSNAFQLTPNLSIGVNASYLFGAINKVTTTFFTDDYLEDKENELKMMNTKVKNKENIYDFIFEYGIQYKFDLKEKSKLMLGAVYQNKVDLKTNKSVLAGTVNHPSSSQLEGFYQDIYSLELEDVVLDTTDIKGTTTLPHSFGIGASYYYKDQWVASFDIIQELWSEIDHDLYNAEYRDLFSIRGGAEYMPDANSTNYYYKRLKYRFGGHYSKTQMQINNTAIDDFGISFGVGIPIKNSNTSFSLAFEFGQRGTLKQNLLKENYGIFSLNISLSDIWFVKRKFK